MPLPVFDYYFNYIVMHNNSSLVVDFMTNTFWKQQQDICVHTLVALTKILEAGGFLPGTLST